MKNTLTDAEKTNQQYWDEIAPVHARAYPEIEMLKHGQEVLDEIELREVGDVRGKKLLHLQCHIGTDTLAWARQGAIVTGVDFSQESLALARQLQQALDLPAAFVQANIYDLPSVLQDQFDVVYTSRGVLCWLKDLDGWARTAAYFLKPGGVFYILESHPVLNMFEETKPGELSITYRYFHRAEPTYWDDDYPDYADAAYTPSGATYEWDWAVSDILNALIKAGLVIEFFNEYEQLFFKRYPGMVERADRQYWFPNYEHKLPLLFTIRARKP